MAKRMLVVVLLLLAAARIADACECVRMPPCQGYWNADAVFTGIVTSVAASENETPGRSQTTILVERAFRGVTGQAVLTQRAVDSCSYRFTVGERYVVYATRNADGTLTTSACAGNQPLAEAEEDVEYAERVPPAGSGGRIFGRVGRIEPDLLDRRKSQTVFPSGVAVTLRDSRGAVHELR